MTEEPTIRLELDMPKPVNFFRVKGQDIPIDVADIDDRTLEALADAMKLLLLENAKKRRAARNTD